jgi:hypothetical protein
MPEFIKNGKKIAPENLIYKWSNSAETYQSQSGFGKNVLILNSSILGKSELVNVTVTDTTNNLAARSSINITPVDPEIIFYENSPYYGHIFDTALTGSFNLKAEEVQILATPFFFTKEINLSYTWRINNQSVPSLDNSMTAIFRKPDDQTSGRSSIALQVSNPNKILQEADSNLTINFNK